MTDHERGIVYDILTQDRVEVTVDNRGVGLVRAITLMEGPMRYVRPGGPRWEHVSAEHVMEAKETARTAPVTDGHPPEFLEPGNLINHAMGIADRRAEVIEKDGKLALRQLLMLLSFNLIQDIQSGKKQISTGREVDFVPERGEFEGVEYSVVQKNPHINHIAIVETGRCGAECSILPDRKFQQDDAVADGVREGVQNLEREEHDQPSGVAVGREVADAPTFKDRVLSVMDPEEVENGELIERVARIVKEDPEDIQQVIAENEEPSLKTLKALAQVLGITQARMRRWAREAFEIRSFDSGVLDGYTEIEPSKDDSLPGYSSI